MTDEEVAEVEEVGHRVWVRTNPAYAKLYATMKGAEVRHAQEVERLRARIAELEPCDRLADKLQEAEARCERLEAALAGLRACFAHGADYYLATVPDLARHIEYVLEAQDAALAGGE